MEKQMVANATNAKIVIPLGQTYHLSERYIKKLWHEYAIDGSGTAVLAKRYHTSSTSMRRLIGSYTAPEWVCKPRPLTVIMDVPYFKGFGVLVACDPYTKYTKDYDRVLYYAVLDGTERTIDYEVAADTIESMGYLVRAVVIDGRRGVRQMLERKSISV